MVWFGEHGCRGSSTIISALCSEVAAARWDGKASGWYCKNEPGYPLLPIPMKRCTGNRDEGGVIMRQH